MATTPTLPSAPASAPVSAPAATSAPVSTPSTPAVSAPAVQTPAAVSTPASSVPTEQRSLEQRIAENIQKGFDKPAEGTTETPSSTEAAAAEAAAHVETSAAGETTATEETPAATETAETQTEEEPFEWDAPQTATPKQILERLNAKPELKAAIEADPEFRDLIFSNARVAAKTQAYSELFGSVDEARTVADGHKAFSNLRGLMSQVKPGDLQSTQPFINAMLEQGALRDDEGNPLRRQDGSLVTDGSVGRLFNNMTQLRLSQLEKEAQASGDNETLAALDTIMERAGFRAPSSAAEDEMSESLKTQKAQLDAQQREIDEQRQAGQKAAETQHNNAVFSKIDSSLDKAIGSILERATGLTPFTRNQVELQLRAGLKKAIAGNSAYQTELDVIERMPFGPKRESRHVSLATRYVQDHLLTVSRPILTDAGVTIGRQAAADKLAQAARAESARSEIVGSSAPARGSAPQTPQQQNAQIRQELTAKLGRPPGLEEMLAESMRRGLAAKRTAA